MSFLVYFAMLIAALVSVVLGLEVVNAPPVKTATKPALVEPIRHAAPVPPATPSPPPAVAQQPAQPAQPVAQPAPRQTVSQSSEPEPIAAPEPAQEPSPAPACNVQACEAAYRSFTAADCTYQPLDGPRRLCTKK
jgi:hypothetical protein